MALNHLVTDPLIHLPVHFLWHVIEKGFGLLQGSKLDRLVDIVRSTIDRTFQGNPDLANTLKDIFDDKKVAQQMGRYLTDKQVSIDTLSEAFKQTDYYRQIQNRCDPKALFSDILTAIEREMAQDEGFRVVLILFYVRNTLGVIRDVRQKQERALSLVIAILGTVQSLKPLLPALKNLLEKQTYDRLKLYGNYFNAVQRRREEELQRLSYYLALPAREMQKSGEIETQLAQPGEKPRWATEVIEDSIKEERNAVISGESGSGKTFTFLMLFNTFMRKYLHGKPSYIPLFVELYMLKEKYNLHELLDGTYLDEKIDAGCYRKDKDKYVVFLDGLNEAPNPEQAFMDIKTLSSRCFISTQRVYDFLQKGRFCTTFQIEPLNPQQVIEYLCNFKEKFPSPQEAEDFYNKKLDECLKEQVRRPVILFFLATLYNETGVVPCNLGDLLTRFADFVCVRKLEKDSLPIAEEIAPIYKEEILPLVAFEMCQQREKALSRQDLKNIITNGKFSSSVNFYDFEVQTSKRYWLLKTSHGASPSSTHRDREGNYEFTLELLRDYFAARYIWSPATVSLGPSSTSGGAMNSGELLKLIFPEDSTQPDPTFSSVTEILCGIVPEQEAVKIINAILPRDPYLAASCFARSSIISLQEDLLSEISKEIDWNDSRYFPSMNKIVQFYKRALELYRSKGLESHPDYGWYQTYLGVALWYKRDHDGAIEAHHKALRVYEQNKRQYHPDYGRFLINLAIALTDKSEYDKAIEACNKALAIFRQNHMQHHLHYGRCQVNLGIALWNKLEYDSAVEAFQNALNVYELNKIQNDPYYAHCQMNLGDVLQDKPDYDGAIGAYIKARSVYEANKMQAHRYYGRCLRNLGRAYYKNGKRGEAMRCLGLAREIFEANIASGAMPRDHSWYKLCLEWIEDASR